MNVASQTSVHARACGPQSSLRARQLCGRRKKRSVEAAVSLSQTDIAAKCKSFILPLPLFAVSLSRDAWAVTGTAGVPAMRSAFHGVVPPFSEAASALRRQQLGASSGQRTAAAGSGSRIRASVMEPGTSGLRSACAYGSRSQVFMLNA